MKKRLLTQLFVGVLALNIAIPAFAGLKTKAALVGSGIGALGTVGYLAYRGAKEVAKDARKYVADNKQILMAKKRALGIKISNAKFNLNEMKNKAVKKAKRTAKIAGQAAVVGCLTYNHDASATVGNALRQGVVTTVGAVGTVTKPVIQKGATLTLDAIKYVTPIASQGVVKNAPAFAKATVTLPVNITKAFYKQPGSAVITTLVTLCLAGQVLYKYEVTKIGFRRNLIEKWNAVKQRVNATANYVKLPAAVAGTCVALSYIKEFRK